MKFSKTGKKFMALVAFALLCLFSTYAMAQAATTSFGFQLTNEVRQMDAGAVTKTRSQAYALVNVDYYYRNTNVTTKPFLRVRRATDDKVATNIVYITQTGSYGASEFSYTNLDSKGKYLLRGKVDYNGDFIGQIILTGTWEP